MLGKQGAEVTHPCCSICKKRHLQGFVKLKYLWKNGGRKITPCELQRVLAPGGLGSHIRREGGS